MPVAAPAGTVQVSSEHCEQGVSGHGLGEGGREGGQKGGRGGEGEGGYALIFSVGPIFFFFSFNTITGFV